MRINVCERCGKAFESARKCRACNNACRNKLWLDANPDKREKMFNFLLDSRLR
jgi:hypothetical protein